MNTSFPWFETSLLLALLGSLYVSLIRNPKRGALLGTWFSGAVFSTMLLAAAGFALGEPSKDWSLQMHFFGVALFQLDPLNAPLLPAVALLHFLTALATPHTKLRTFSFSWSLFSEFLRLLAFSCSSPWPLIVFLSLGTIPPIVELANRKRSTRMYLQHMGCFVILMVAGWSLAGRNATLGSILLMGAVLIRCGVAPAHCWLVDWLENASFGNAILFVTPLAGLYAAIRLLLPIAPDWVLRTMSVLALITALYASGLALVQNDSRRFFAYLFLSHSSLVLVGLELPESLAGALCLWFSVALSLAGIGLTLRALEARFGRLSFERYRGLYDHTPILAICFLLTGLACVGFPGTLGFVSTELLVDGVVSTNPWFGVVVAISGALNGIAVVRAYFRLFTGARHASTVSLGIGARERLAVLTLAALILGGGLFPQPGVHNRFEAANIIWQDRLARRGSS